MSGVKKVAMLHELVRRRVNELEAEQAFQSPRIRRDLFLIFKALELILRGERKAEANALAVIGVTGRREIDAQTGLPLDTDKARKQG